MTTRTGPDPDRATTAARTVAGDEKGAGFTGITRLRQRVIRPVINHDDSGSMLLALFAMMILTSLVTVVLMATIAQQAKTRKATDFTFAGQAADTAVNDALIKANNGVVPPDTVLPVTGAGVTGDFRWSWSSTQPTPSALTREITATGCRNNATSSACKPNSTRTIKATLSGVVYESASNLTGEVTYVLTPKRSFNRALFADQDLIMQGSSKVTSYSSTTDLPGVPGFGQVATNDSADFGPAVDLNGIYMLNTQTYPNNGRCNVEPLEPLEPLELSQCDPLRTPRLVHEIGPKLQVSDTIVTEEIAKAWCVKPLTAWVASENSGSLSGKQCYSSMNFNATTTVVGTAEVYVTGPITISAGVPVRINKPNSTPVASALQIFSSGPVVSLGGGEATATRTEVAWALWAPNARCAPSTPTGFVTVYGAMVCQKIFAPGGFIAQWDEALRTLAPTDGLATVWDISAYRDGS